MKNIGDIENLIGLGLTEREAKVYLVLLGSKKMTASVLPKFAGIPRTKIYEVLVSLLNKGFCREISTGNKRKEYIAVNPQIALNGLIEKEEEKINQMKSKNLQLLSHLSDIYEQSSDRLANYDFIEVLKGKAEISSRYSELRDSVKSELLEFTKGPYAMTSADMEKEVADTTKLLKRGANIQVMYEEDDLLREGVVAKVIKAEAQMGIESRSLPFIPIKMCLFDNLTIILALDDPIGLESQLTALVIKDANLYNVLKQAFLMYWTQAKPLVAANIKK